jgi:sec-independent protein translocase protein TatB
VFLFIFESVGTSELILIGIVALIFLGPRKMPEYAKKIGKLMSDFRSTTSEFKETWQREVNFEEEVKAFRIEDDVNPSVPIGSIIASPEPADVATPEIKEIDPADFPGSTDSQATVGEESVTAAANVPKEFDPNDKRNWL